MGQFLVVKGGSPETARALFDQGLAAFQAIHEQRPDATAQVGAATHLAKFARKRVPGTMLVRDTTTGDCGLAVGGFVSEGAADDHALRKLVTAATSNFLADAERGLDGYFVLVAANGRTGQVTVMTDRVGGLHAYRTQYRGCAIVSTSSLVLAALTGAALDAVAVREFLASGSVFEARSLYVGVEKLAAASVFTFSGADAPTSSTWWNLADSVWDRAPSTGSAETLATAIVDAQRTLLGAYRHPLLDLTGGFDSRNLLAAAMRSGHQFATVVNGLETYPDVVIAGRIAQEFGLDHRNQRPGIDFPIASFEDFARVAALGDGEANVFDYAATAHAQALSCGEFDLAVNGSYGELCRGYWWDLLSGHFWSRTRFDARRVATSRFMGEAAWCEALTPGLGAPPLEQHFTDAVERSVADLSSARDTAKADLVYLRMRMQRWGGRIASLTSRIRPSAAPFMFKGPLIAALSMPPTARCFGRGARQLVQTLSPRLAALKTDSGSPAAPFSPLNAWRFAPLAALYAGKAARRAGRTLGLSPRAAATPKTGRAGDVWRLSEMHDLLRPATMLTRELYDDQRLAQFIERCRGDGASPASTLGRIVTLELATRAVAGAVAARKGTGPKGTGPDP